MNNYKAYEDYYNYINNNYNQPNYNQENKNINIYDPYNGFIRGNLFPDLFNDYKIGKPFEIKPMNEQAELLTYIDSLGFACNDLALYLDIYPDDRESINLFNNYKNNLKEYMNKYQEKFGPLLRSSESLNSYPWKWIASPWPWERGE